MNSCAASIAAIGMMLWIIGGGGAFKQVLIVGGVGKYIGELFLWEVLFRLYYWLGL